MKEQYAPIRQTISILAFLGTVFPVLLAGCRGKTSLLSGIPAATITTVPPSQGGVTRQPASPTSAPSVPRRPSQPSPGACPSPSWDILFESFREDADGDGQITWADERFYTMHADGSGVNPTTPVPFSYDHGNCRRSANGDWIAAPSGTDMLMRRADGSLTQTVALALDRIDAWCWSPDSQQLAVGGIRKRNGSSSLVIYLINRDRERATPVLERVFSPGQLQPLDLPMVRDFHWDRAGNRLFFVSPFEGLAGINPAGTDIPTPDQLYAVDLDSKELSCLEKAGIVSHPRWSPDDRTILYSRWGGPEVGWSLWLIDSTGETPRALMKEEILVPVGSGEWSPGGCWIVFSSDWDPVESAPLPAPEIFVIRADGTGLQRLTNDSFGDYQPIWIP